MATVVAHMKEWKSVHMEQRQHAAPTPRQRWQPPDDGWLKINSDGATSRHGDKGGGGAVLRDHHGAFRAGLCHHFPNIADPEATEILACRRALELAREINAQRIHLELDSQALVQMLKQPTKNLGVTGPWVEDLKLLLHSFQGFKVSWVRRSANVAAHKFAKVGVGDELCKVWLEAPPDFVLDVISDDIPNFVF
nr:uncharacterized protein LOC120968821 [Aegilops tauschii subsp. strangulata]